MRQGDVFASRTALRMNSVDTRSWRQAGLSVAEKGIGQELIRGIPEVGADQSVG